MSGMTHRDFALVDDEFRKACERAKVQPTKRQAARFRQRRGQAFAAAQSMRAERLKAA